MKYSIQTWSCHFPLLWKPIIEVIADIDKSWGHRGCRSSFYVIVRNNHCPSLISTPKSWFTSSTSPSFSWYQQIPSNVKDNESSEAVEVVNWTALDSIVTSYHQSNLWPPKKETLASNKFFSERRGQRGQRGNRGRQLNCIRFNRNILWSSQPLAS